MKLGYSEEFTSMINCARENPELIDLSKCDPPRFGFRPQKTIMPPINQIMEEIGYPDTRQELIEHIATRTTEYTGEGIQPVEVNLTSGLAGGFASLAVALKGYSLGLQSPFYGPAYEFFRKTTDLWYFRCPPENSWGPDLDQLRQTLEKKNNKGVIFLVNPSNPTGHVYSQKEVRSIVNLAGEYNQVLISDEVYDEMSFVPFTSVLGQSPDVPIIYLHGFSKVWRAPEIRLGYIILHDPLEKATLLFNEIRRICNLSFGINPYSQTIAQHLLQESPEFRRNQFQQIQRKRDILYEAMQNSSNLRGIRSKGATYQVVETPWNDWAVCKHLIKKHGILVTPGSAYDPFIQPNYLRVVFLNTDESLRKFASILDMGIK